MSDIKDIADFIVWNRNALDELQTKNPQLSEAVKAVLLELTQKYTGVQIPQGTLSIPTATDSRVYDSTVNLPQEIKEKILGNFDRFKFLANVINRNVLSPEGNEKIIYSVIDIEEVTKFSGLAYILYFREINFLNGSKPKYFKVEISNIDQFMFSDYVASNISCLSFEILPGASKNITVGQHKSADWLTIFPSNTSEYIEDFLFQVPYYLVTIDGIKQKLYYNGMKFEKIDFPIMNGVQTKHERYQKVYSFEDRSNNNYYYVTGDQLYDFLCSEAISLHPQLNKTTSVIYLDTGLRSPLLVRLYRKANNLFSNLLGNCIAKDKFLIWNTRRNYYSRYLEVVKNNASNKEFRIFQGNPYSDPSYPHPRLTIRPVDEIDNELTDCFMPKNLNKYLPIRYDETVNNDYFDSLDFETGFYDEVVNGNLYAPIFNNTSYNRNLSGMKIDPKPLKEIIKSLDCYDSSNSSKKYKVTSLKDIWELSNTKGNDVRYNYEFLGSQTKAADGLSLIINLHLTLLKPNEQVLAEYVIRRFQNEFFYLFLRNSSLMTPSSYFRNTPVLPLINSVRLTKDNRVHICSVLEMLYDIDKNCIDICVTSSSLNHTPIYLSTSLLTPGNNKSLETVSNPISFSSSADSIFVNIGDKFNGIYHHQVFTDGEVVYLTLNTYDSIRYTSSQVGRDESTLFGRVIPENQRVLDLMNSLRNLKTSGGNNIEIELPVYVVKTVSTEIGVILSNERRADAFQYYNSEPVPENMKIVFEANKDAITWGGRIECRLGGAGRGFRLYEVTPSTFLTNDEFRKLAYDSYNKEIGTASTQPTTTQPQINDTVKAAMKVIGERYNPGDRVNNGNVIGRDIESFDWPEKLKLEAQKNSGFDEISVSYRGDGGGLVIYTIWSSENGQFAEIVYNSKGKKSKTGGYKQNIETKPEELEFDLSLAPNVGDRKSPSQSAGDLQDRFRQSSKIYKYIQNVLFMGNDGLFYKVTETAKGDWKWTKSSYISVRKK